MHKLNGLWVLVVLMFVLAACGGNKSQSDKDSGDSDKWSTTNVKREDTSNRGDGSSGKKSNSADAGGNKSGANSDDSGKMPDPQPDPEPTISDEPVARTDIEGKITEFKHVIAMWDEVNHSVRFIASTEEIPEDQYPRLRNGEPIEGETPHFIMSFVLEEGTTKLDKAKVENWFYDFYWLTSLSPMSLRNIGKETISLMSGTAKVGETLKLIIDFKSANVKDAPDEKIDFDVQFEVKLQ
ncbi:MAG: hypothetical protein KDB90_12705 [Planctomycetes bacterium]|nr:hypothetical protein [Planctomycetota bacterium]